MRGPPERERQGQLYRCTEIPPRELGGSSGVLHALTYTSRVPRTAEAHRIEGARERRSHSVPGDPCVHLSRSPRQRVFLRDARENSTLGTYTGRSRYVRHRVLTPGCTPGRGATTASRPGRRHFLPPPPSAVPRTRYSAERASSTSIAFSLSLAASPSVSLAPLRV